MRIYLDGNLAQETTFSGSLIQNNIPLNIGWEGQAGFPTEHWNGLIDEVGVYNRALSAAEIQAIFAAGSAGKCKTLDSDGDGVDDADDACPDSDLSGTIVINGDDTGVENELMDDGCTLADLIAELLAQDPSTADVVQFLVALKAEGIITGQQMGGMLQAATP